MSVDCEVQYNVSEGGVGSGQGQEMEIDPEREPVLPSIPSKPMTVSELRRGLHFYSTDLPQKGTISINSNSLCTPA